MSEDLEKRLRRDLSTLDAVPIGGNRAVEEASRAARARSLRRRRWPAIGGASLLLIGAAAAAGTWFARNGREAPVTVDGSTSSATPDEATAASSPAGPIGSDGDALPEGPAPDPTYQSLSYGRDDHGTRRFIFHFDGQVEDIPAAVVEDLNEAAPGQVSVGQQPQTGSATICGTAHGGTPGNVELLFPEALFGPRGDSELLDVRLVDGTEEFWGKILACPVAGHFVQVWIALDGSPTLDRFDVVAADDTISLIIFDSPIDGPLVQHPRPPTDSVGAAAEVRGVLELEGSCLYARLDEVDERYPLIWPYGTRWDGVNNAVIPPSGAPIPVGATVYGGGAYYSVDNIGKIVSAEVAAAASRCVDKPGGEIAVVNNDDVGVELGSG